MKSILFVIAADPRTSGRAAEAVRMAAGLSAWKKIEVSLYLCDAAVLMLQPATERLIDEENFARYFPILQENGRPIYIQETNPLLTGPGVVPSETVSAARLAALAAEHHHVLRF